MKLENPEGLSSIVLGLLLIVSGLSCLFFPGLIVFGYGAEGFDWVVVSFLVVLCILIIIMGLKVMKL